MADAVLDEGRARSTPLLHTASAPGLLARAAGALEGAPLPDVIVRAAARALISRSARRLEAAGPDASRAFAAAMDGRPIAEHADLANRQHYEVPPEFFEAVLGPALKYSCCWFPTGREDLAEAERLALEETARRADLADGARILELGCGWGSLSLHMAETLPNARIVSVSNSASQRRRIEARAAERGVTNLTVVTADANRFEPEGRFDRVVSVEMFEHMSNWRALLARIRGWMVPEGRLFLHVFSHRRAPYRFDVDDPTDWVAQHFFAGGIMPSHDLPACFPDLFEPEADWRWSGRHYQRTARLWLERYDARRTELRPLFRAVYGPHARLWERRWRLFFISVEELFGAEGGETWGVSHHRLRPAP